MLPWGQQQQAAFGTSLHRAACGLGVVSEAVLTQMDERTALEKQAAHDGLLARRDARRDKDHATRCILQALLTLGFDLLSRETTRTLHYFLLGIVEEKAVADGRKAVAGIFEVVLHTEEVTVLALHHQAVRVVVKIAAPPLHLPFIIQQTVVVAKLPEHITVFVMLFLGILLFVENDTAKGCVTGFLKATDDIAKMPRHPLMDKENAMQVVGHELEIDNGDLWHEVRDMPPCIQDGEA